MTDFYSQNRCVCSTRSHGPLLCAFCLSFHFNVGRCKMFSRCGYDLSFIPGINFVAGLCTLSIAIMCLSMSMTMAIRMTSNVL